MNTTISIHTRKGAPIANQPPIAPYHFSHEHSTHRLNCPPLSILRPLNLHPQGIRHSNQDFALRNSDISDAKVSKYLQRFQTRAAPENRSCNEVIDLLAETEINSLQLRISFVWREDGFESFEGDVATGVDVEVL